MPEYLERPDFLMNMQVRNLGVRGVWRWLVGGLLAWVGLLQAATFNVTDYGAVGDDKTDNTAAFSACLATPIT
jgi:hypothetical protein